MSWTKTSYCNSITNYSRLKTDEVLVGEVGIGGNNPIRIQSMTTTDTMDTEASVKQVISLIKAGAEGSMFFTDLENSTIIKCKDGSKRGIDIASMYYGKKLGYMLSGGETNPSTILSEQNLYDLEREIFIDLIKQKPTQERIRHTLDTGKPLFN